VIDSLHVENFQSHKYTKLELSRGINVIVGSSDSGKTALIRALRWLICNRPQGQEFQSSWGGPTWVEIVADGVIITRTRSSSDNLYLLKARDTSKFAALRGDVPQEIAQALNINEINLQQQFDMPFLLNESPGVVAQHFNKIAHLDIIDRAISNTQSWIRQHNEQITADENLLTELQASLFEYQYLDALEEQIQAAEILESKFEAGLARHHDLSYLLDKIKVIDAQIEAQQTLIRNQEAVEEALALYQDHSHLQKARSELINKIQEIQNLEASIEFHQDQATKLQAKFDREFPELCPLCGAFTRRKR